MTVKLKETAICLDYSFFAVVSLMLVFCKREIVLICLLSSAFHEMGHLFLMWLFKEKVLRVVFGAFGIRIEKASFSSLSYKKEAAVALGGVAADFILAAFFLFAFKISGSLLALSGAFVNVFIALLNLIPVGMLDSGNFLRYILLERFDEEKATLISEKISDVFVVLFVVGCAVYTAFFGVNISLVALSSYLIILNLKPGRKWFHGKP
ncbi:MAG: hypothetical protein IJ262_05310 [Clostridia bacterium]|nr:hypothetical protein [Clostridia bacterium]